MKCGRSHSVTNKRDGDERDRARSPIAGAERRSTTPAASASAGRRTACRRTGTIPSNEKAFWSKRPLEVVERLPPPGQQHGQQRRDAIAGPRRAAPSLVTQPAPAGDALRPGQPIGPLLELEHERRREQRADHPRQQLEPVEQARDAVEAILERHQRARCRLSESLRDAGGDVVAVVDVRHVDPGRDQQRAPAARSRARRAAPRCAAGASRARSCAPPQVAEQDVLEIDRRRPASARRRRGRWPAPAASSGARCGAPRSPRARARPRRRRRAARSAAGARRRRPRSAPRAARRRRQQRRGGRTRARGRR